MRDELYIGGKWRSAVQGGKIPVFNPYTGEVLHHVAAGGPQDVDLAVTAAKAALPAWRRTSGSVRGMFLSAIAAKARERQDELARLSSRNNGKPLAETLIDMQDVASSFEYYGGLAAELDRERDGAVKIPDGSYRATLRREPIGVAGLGIISCIDSFDGRHPNVFVPSKLPHEEFSSIEDTNNHMLQHKEVIDHVRKRGGKPAEGSRTLRFAESNALARIPPAEGTAIRGGFL